MLYESAVNDHEGDFDNMGFKEQSQPFIFITII